MKKLLVCAAALLLGWLGSQGMWGDRSSPDPSTASAMRAQKATTIHTEATSAAPSSTTSVPAAPAAPFQREDSKDSARVLISEADARAWRELLLPALQSPWQLAELEAAMVRLGGPIQKTQAGHPKSGLRWELTSADGLIRAVYILGEDGSPSHLQAIRIQRVLSPEARQALHRDLDQAVPQARLRSGDDHVIYGANSDDYQLWIRWYPGDSTQPDEIVIERVECPHGAEHNTEATP